jgi:hypothetical protein
VAPPLQYFQSEAAGTIPAGRSPGDLLMGNYFKERNMKRPIFAFLVILVLALAAGLTAQTYPDTQAAPSQQVDQSGQPEQTGKPDVDVDTGANASGAVDVDVKAHGDADTDASGVNETGETTDTAADNANLPGTASDTPLLGLLGLASLAGALALRANR